MKIVLLSIIAVCSVAAIGFGFFFILQALGTGGRGGDGKSDVRKWHVITFLASVFLLNYLQRFL